MIPAHAQIWSQRVRVRLMITPHEPRGKDPYAALFRRVKRTMRELDVPCWRCGVRLSDITREGKGSITDRNPLGACQIEAHHDEVEFSLAEGVDLQRFVADHPEFHVHDHDSFLRWLESEGNLLALCDQCHRSGDQGIHFLAYPLWKMARIWRRDLPPLVQPAA